MHDETLDRTTDVAAVFPGRESDLAESFTLAEVQQLNAGQWFLQTDPYRKVAGRLVTDDQTQSYQRLTVPTLAEELEVASKNHLVLIFDLKQPPQDHPYYQQFFDIVFEQIRVAGIDSQIWFLADQQQARIIQASAPKMILVHGTDYQHPPQPSDLLANGYQIVNADFSLAPEWIHAYHAAGLWVNLYTVDEPWQYSRLWLLGVELDHQQQCWRFAGAAQAGIFTSLLHLPGFVDCSRFGSYRWVGPTGLPTAVMNWGYLSRPFMQVNKTAGSQRFE